MKFHPLPISTAIRGSEINSTKLLIICRLNRIKGYIEERNMNLIRTSELSKFIGLGLQLTLN